MPCRAVSLCRQAVSPSPHIWITDDILSEAWHRFARGYHVHKSGGHAEGRRYGSNVPGPLEAHRRSARRRMGVAAIAATGNAAGADLGALFGFGGLERERRVGEWKYEPPGAGFQAKRRDGPWINSAQKEKKEKDGWETFLDAVVDPMAAEEEANDLIATSKAAFEQLLSSKEHYGEIQEPHLADLVAFLRSTADEPEAHNTLRLSQWLKQRTISDSALVGFTALILEKTRLRTLDSHELSSALASVFTYNKTEVLRSPITGILDALAPDGILQTVCENITRTLLEVVGSASGDLPRMTGPAQLHAWLECLQDCKHMQGPHSGNPAWYAVYEPIASCFPWPVAFKEHLSTLRRKDLARVLLRHWVPQIIAERPAIASSDALELPTKTSQSGKCFKILSWRQHEPVSIDDLVEKFEVILDERTAAQVRPDSFVDLLMLLQRHGFPAVRLTDHFFSILMHSYEPATIYQTFRLLQHCGSHGITCGLGVRLIHHFLAANKIRLALAVFRNVPTIPLNTSFELPLKLVRDGVGSSPHIWSVLQRHIPGECVPSPDRSPEMPGMKLTPDHIDLIHLVAFAFAESPHISSRTAYRRVHQCYLFLRDRRAPINSLMTRAFVIAGIIRPFKEQSHISTVKFRYILSLLANVEGREVAEAIDRLVYRLWHERITHPELASKVVDEVLGPAEDAARHAQAIQSRLYSVEGKKRRWISAGFPSH